MKEQSAAFPRVNIKTSHHVYTIIPYELTSFL